jgi:hypothetical protein
MKQYKEIHPQLKALQVLWNIPEETLNTILWVNTWEENKNKSLAIGYACQYIEWMVEVCEVNSPEEAWEEWCLMQDIEHEVDNNPYLI